ncbi:hypothetical protein [Gelidibacter sp. F63206]|uniref:hypothetical protein n=1 Tax=Gelidibacter sp. F63206 TaxID=2926425 RepID=UPI001FF30399|nr:hypothetical protein [Gelidibacter sp. F63206]MCK0114966.1 hypothetical protein [Gelidibacter sp. F63206]
MKNIFILFLTIAFFSCSSNDDNSSNDNNLINPPNWIQGTWLLETSPITSGFRFTSNDFCLISSTSEICNKETLKLYQGSQVITNVKEKISSGNYELSITIGSSIQTYRFEKVSSTEIRWLDIGVNAIYTKQ